MIERWKRFREKLRHPSLEERIQALEELGATNFLYQPLRDVAGFFFYKPGEVRFVFTYGVNRRGKLIFVVKEEDLISLGFQPKEKEGFIIPFSGDEKVEYVDQISVPFTEVVRGQMITGINFESLEKTSKISLKLSDESQISLNVSKGARGKVIVKETRLIREIKTIMMPS